MQAFVREFPVLRDEPVAGGSVLAGVGGAEFEAFREGRCLFLGAYGGFHFFLKDEYRAVGKVHLSGERPTVFPVFVERRYFG